MAGRIHPSVLLLGVDESLTRMLQLVWRKAGSDTTEVTTGGNARQMLQQERPDATVPGLQLASRMSLEEREARVRLIYEVG